MEAMKITLEHLRRLLTDWRAVALSTRTTAIDPSVVNDGFVASNPRSLQW